MNKTDLIQKVKALDGLSQDERAYLINLVNTKKKYGLVWEDKPEEVEEQLRENLPVLKEVKEKAIINGDATLSGVEVPNHILIEGDNLHALTALTFTHESKIDVIYIDPPYNTGNKDFKYNDSFVDKEDSYRHSKWLSFIDKRLRIAKRLLSDKGVIFISIDDNEGAQLKIICDEIFRELNFLGNIIWQSRTSISNDDFISNNHNYTLIYAKNKLLVKFDGEPINHSEYTNPDNDSRGPWKLTPIDANKVGGDTVYPITNPKTGKEYYPPNKRIWAFNRITYRKLYDDGRIKFGMTNDSSPKRKLFLNERLEKGDSKTPSSILVTAGTTKDGTNELIEILDIKKFDYPKPSSLIGRFLTYSTQFHKSAIILDFFAGSGTTLHASMQLNAADNGNRQCILVTNNENNICEEVTYERNKRVIQGYTNSKGVEVVGLKNNNLRYYKSEFVGRQTSLKNKRALTNLATELLCIKEDIYTEIKAIGKDTLHNTAMKGFLKENTYLLMIYNEEVIDQVVDIIKKAVTNSSDTLQFKVYVFSNGQYPYTEEFEEVLEHITLCALPDAIYKAYQNVLPKKKRQTLPQLEEDIDPIEPTLFD